MEITSDETSGPCPGPRTGASRARVRNPGRGSVVALAVPSPMAEPGARPEGDGARKRPRHPISPRSNAFRRLHFPAASPAEWNDWQWQLRNRFRNLADLERVLTLSEEERAALAGGRKALPVAITPYYASLIDPGDPSQPIRRTHVPVIAEAVVTPGEATDPLHEGHDSPVPGLVHRYPDRVLFLTTGSCSTYCRYCTRSRLVGCKSEPRVSLNRWERAIAYIESHREVRDVVLSGGDPLTLTNDRLEWLLARLRRIKHLEIIRIGTKVPAVLPMRVTPDLTRMLKRYHPLFMSLHFAHPGELTPETTTACTRLADAGIPLGSQTVLLAGVNDDVATMRDLMHGLLKARVRPYYIYQCDPITGSSHFRTTVEKGLEIIAGLRGFTSGYAVPTFVVDAPGGGGKIPLIPDPVVGRDGSDLLLRNYEGLVHRYPDPRGHLGAQTETTPCA